MKIAIPSAGRAATICTHRMIAESEDVHIVTHDQHDKLWYDQNLELSHCTIHKSDQPRGIAYQRNWILDNLAEDGEWVAMMDDNIRWFERIAAPFYFQEKTDVRLARNAPLWRKIYRRFSPWFEMTKVFQECIDRAESIGAHFIGFATNDNPYFRYQKWYTHAFVMTKMCLIKKSTLRFDTAYRAKDDVEFTARNLQRFGKVLVNNFARAEAFHLQPGGIGNQKVRLAATIQEAKRLTETYPQFFRINKARKPVGSEVILKVKPKTHERLDGS